MGNECEQDNGLCEDQCVNTQGSYFCSCGNGYQLGQNNRECQDIDECNNPNTCSFGYVCVNTWGSYHCLTGAFAAASVGADLSVIAGSATSSTNIIGIVVALALALVNVAVLGMLAARIVRMKRRQAQQPEAPSQSTKGAFRSEAGTIRSFNSLVSKFGPAVDPDSISTVSSISS